MLCPKCSHSNPDENHYCGNCGAPLETAKGTTLKDLLDAGILKAGGKIKYQEKTYDGPLACATAIRGQTCDSWYCWRAADHASDRSYALGHYRAALTRQRENQSGTARH